MMKKKMKLKFFFIEMSYQDFDISDVHQTVKNSFTPKPQNSIFIINKGGIYGKNY